MRVLFQLHSEFYQHHRASESWRLLSLAPLWLSFQGLRLAPRALKLIYTPEDPYAIIYTGATVSEEVYACVEDYNDSSYPCRNGDLSRTFAKVPQPPQPASPNQELLWPTPNFFYVAGINFTDYTVFFMKKNAQGILTENLGSAKFGFRLLNDNLREGQSGELRSSSGPNVFSYTCLSPGSSAANGYQAYPYSYLNCYYKITN